MKYLLAIFVACLLISGWALAAGDDDDKETCPRHLGGDGAALLPSYVNANNTFGWDLYSRLAFGSKNNEMISPISATFALQMAMRGANGLTRTQIATVLRQADVEKRYRAAQSLLRALTSPDTQEIVRISNSIWSDDQRFTFSPDYVRVMRGALRADCVPVDFSNTTEALAKINNHVKTKTRKMIDPLLKTLPPNIAALLLNTLYFDGKFTTPFSERETKEADFHRLDGTISRVQMMHAFQMEGEFAESDDHLMLSLSFKKDDYSGGYFRADFVVPKADVGLTQAAYEALVAKLEAKVVDTYLPKFTFSNTYHLKAILEAMGMKEAFSPTEAQFRAMGTSRGGQRLFASDVISGSATEVKESGVRMAAGTAIPMALERMVGQPTKKFVADKPFYMLLRHAPTNTVLFMGQVTNPTYTAKPQPAKPEPEEGPAPELGPVTPLAPEIVAEGEDLAFRVITPADEARLTATTQFNASNWIYASQSPKAKDWGKRISYGWAKKGVAELQGVFELIDPMHPDDWRHYINWESLPYPATQGYLRSHMLGLDRATKPEEYAAAYRVWAKFAFAKLGAKKLIEVVEFEEHRKVLELAGFKKVGTQRLPGGLGEASSYDFYELNP